MLTHFRRPVCLSVMSADLAICSNVETVGTLYQRDAQRFHLLLTEPKVCEPWTQVEHPGLPSADQLRLIWIEMSPLRVTMTMQGNGKLSYRHLWERNAYGLSRYWLQGDAVGQSHQLQLRNFTVGLHLDGNPLPTSLALEYELWSAHSRLGRYTLQLDIQH
ncbi:MAG: hypothetical protein B0A82_21230 [Alkalinema sp. CACIAM 70d]|nr:MAG: hypothetical protein B0A82_21230 [Alkalinema sp. CACIAM 70d]